MLLLLVVVDSIKRISATDMQQGEFTENKKKLDFGVQRARPRSSLTAVVQQADSCHCSTYLDADGELGDHASGVRAHHGGAENLPA